MGVCRRYTRLRCTLASRTSAGEIGCASTERAVNKPEDASVKHARPRLCPSGSRTFFASLWGLEGRPPRLVHCDFLRSHPMDPDWHAATSAVDLTKPPPLQTDRYWALSRDRAYAPRGTDRTRAYAGGRGRANDVPRRPCQSRRSSDVSSAMSHARSIASSSLELHSPQRLEKQ
jgi:hypothetical protein